MVFPASHKLIATVMLLSCVTNNAYAGAWTQKENQLQIISGATVYRASEFYDVRGNAQDQLPFYKGELSTYAEYGLSDIVTLGGQVTYAGAFQQTTPNHFGSTFSFGDAELFVRSRVWKDDYNIISVQPFLILPSSDNKSDSPKIGSDNMSAGLKASYGHSFQLLDQWHYADVGVAYVKRGGNPSDQLKLEATAGFNLSNSWQIRPQIFLTENHGEVRAAQFTQSSADNYNSSTAQLSTVYQYNDETAFQVGVFGNIAGKNTGVGRGVFVNLIFQLDCNKSCLAKR